MSDYVSYQQAGVNIDANDAMVERISSSVASTFGPRVMALPNGFAGLLRLDYDERLFKKNFKTPVLVACTDGVGSKVQLAAKVRKYDTIGIDLVAMSVNDMLVVGAEPLLFLDYVALIGARPPSKGLQPADSLKGCEVLVATATVKHRIQGRRRVELPEDCWYSKIDRLVKITAGSPPCMRARTQRGRQ